MAFLLALLAFLASSAAATSPSAGACSSDIAARFTPLSDYGPATDFCSQAYPSFANSSSSSTTTTTTITTCVPSSSSKRHTRRQTGAGGQQQHGIPNSWHTLQTLSSPSPQTPQNPDLTSLFQSLQQQDSTTLSEICSCVAAAAANTNTNTQTVQITCASWESCNPTTHACEPVRDCYNPAQCDASSFCGTNSGGQDLFCHMDTDDANAGYCMDAGPGGKGCPEEYEDCASNGDCSDGDGDGDGDGGASGRICVYACCREEPFCVDVGDYKGVEGGGGGGGGGGNGTFAKVRRERSLG